MKINQQKIHQKKMKINQLLYIRSKKPGAHFKALPLSIMGTTVL